MRTARHKTIPVSLLGPGSSPFPLSEFDGLHGGAVVDDHGHADALGRRGDLARNARGGQRGLEVVRFEGDVGHRPDELGDLAAGLETHPLDAERARLETRDVEVEMRI
jgi:hypothetical protein